MCLIDFSPKYMVSVEEALHSKDHPQRNGFSGTEGSDSAEKLVFG